MFEPRRQFLFLTITDASATCAVVIFTSVDSSGHWTDWSIKVSVKENEVPTEKNSSRASIFATKASYISNQS